MPFENGYFPWFVAEKGYGWLETDSINQSGRRESGLYLTNDWSADGRSLFGTKYFPLEKHSGLFRVFAETDLSQECIKSFADRFGLLGGDIDRMIKLPHRPTEKGHVVGHGEKLGSWHLEIMNIQEAILVWDLARHGEIADLSRWIRWDEDRRGVSFERRRGDDDPDALFLESAYTIASERIHQELLERFKPGDVLEPAMYFVQNRINDHLKEKVSARVMWNQDHALELHYVPWGLLSALWLQFARAVESNNEYRSCAECKDWFEISPATARTNRAYCSNRCRNKAYRKRKEEARSLFQGGLSVEEIANKMDVDPASVGRWVQG